MRTTLLVWLVVIGVSLVLLSTTASRYASARSRADSALDRLADVRETQARLAALRAGLPSWATLRPSEGLAPRVADSLAACGLPASTMTSLSANAESVLVQATRLQHINTMVQSSTTDTQSTDTRRPGDTGGSQWTGTSAGGVKSRKASLTLSPISLSQLGRFIDAWRQREPAWIITGIDLALVTIAPSGIAATRTKGTTTAGERGTGVTGMAGGVGGAGGELPLRAVLTIESLWLDTPLPLPPTSPTASNTPGGNHP